MYIPQIHWRFEVNPLNHWVNQALAKYNKLNNNKGQINAHTNNGVLAPCVRMLAIPLTPLTILIPLPKVLKSEVK